jgi:HAAS
MKNVTTIEQYLDQLADELIASPRRTRRILAETQDHLYSARQSLIDGGMPPEEAEETALQQFGAPSVVARGFRPGLQLTSLPFIESLGTTLLGLAAVGFIAIGLSGVLSSGFGAVAGKDFVSGDLPGVTYTPQRCGDFLRFHPEAGTCEDAATAHHYDEVVFQRLDVGILGLLALAAYFAARRFRHARRLPAVFAPTIGAALFGIAGVGFTLMSIGQTVTGGSGGAGAYLSGGLVCLVFAAAFSLRLLPLLEAEASD